MAEINRIRPQDGYQLKALSNSADIVIGGAAAGVGKTFSLLLEPLKHITTVEGFGGVIFRRTTPQIRNEGGLWDTSMSLYTKIPMASPRESSLEWTFKKDTLSNKLKFAHIEYEKNVYDWQGSQIPFIAFDELTHFSEKMFFYLLSRNRSACGVKPYIRATCNPDPESWVSELISWWIGEDGYPIKERDGVIRYFIKNGNEYVWGDSYNEVYEQCKYFLDDIILESSLQKEDFIKSLSFVSGSIYENRKLLEVNPEYLANLMALDEDEKNALLKGNWKISNDENQIYDYLAFNDMFNNSFSTKTNRRTICADIAMKGSNKMIIGYFEGKSLEDIDIIDRNDGKEAVTRINQMAAKHRVSNSNIIFDADGVGSYIDGYIIGAVPFHGGATPIEVVDKTSGKRIKENYFNLKTQLYYHSAMAVYNGEYSISESVANKMYDQKSTVKQRMAKERKAIKKDKVDHDGKKRLLPKKDMKIILNGDSPDIFDMFSLNEWFGLRTTGTFMVQK